MIDIVDIKSHVKKGNLKFFLENGYIYCKDIKSEETVLVGDYQELVIKNNGIIVREKGKSKSIGFNPDGTYNTL